MIIKFITYGVIGWCMEILYTGICSLLKGDLRMSSTTSVWMFFIYGLAVFLGPICGAINGFPVVLRGVIYVIGIYAVEYITGFIMKKLDACPWDYSESKYNINGLIRMDYAPLWFFAGLFFEFINFKF